MAAPLPQYKREYITSLLALGNTKAQIIAKVKKRYGHEIHPTTITRLKKQNALAIADAHDHIAAGSEIVGAAALKQKSYRLLDRKLDRALEDDSEIDKIRLKFRSGEIDKDEFDKEVARYEVLTINELTKVADSMHTHLKTAEDEQPLSPQDQAAMKMIMEGIKSGNPTVLVQALNPQAMPSVETPARHPGSP